MAETVLFYLFSLLTLSGAILTITRRSVVVSAIWLVATLLGVGGLFLLAGAEFLFAGQLIVYVGGIVLLFLIALMLIQPETALRPRRFRRGWPAVLLLACALAGELVLLLVKGRLPQAKAAPSSLLAPAMNTEAVADSLFSHYLVAFELASLLLLVAVIGAVLMGQKREDA